MFNSSFPDCKICLHWSIYNDGRVYLCKSAVIISPLLDLEVSAPHYLRRNVSLNMDLGYLH